MRRFWLALFLLCLCAPALAQTGTIPLAWDAVPGATGYRIGWGFSTGTYGTNRLDVATTAGTISGLTDCTTYFVAVKSRSASGVESANWSNEVRGWPRPRVTAVAPATIEAGAATSVTFTGANFAPGAGLVLPSGLTSPGLTVVDCRTARATLTAAPTASGSLNMTLINTDRTAVTTQVTVSVPTLPTPMNFRRTDQAP